MNKFRLSLYLICFALLFFTLGLLVSSKISRDRNLEVEAINIISHNFDGEFSSEIALEGLASKLDPYSYFVSKEDYKKIKLQNEGVHTGIGIIYVSDGNSFKIISILPNSPAYNANIIKNSYIKKINDTSTSDLNSDQVYNLLKGEVGQAVNLELEYLGQARSVVLNRAVLNESIQFQELPNKTAYIKIFQFWSTTYEEFEKLIPRLLDRDKIIFDLRDNLGGNTESMLKIEGNFVDDKIILIEKFKNSGDIISKGSKGAALKDKDIIILSNHETSSAAEEFIVGMKVRENTKIIGERTFGKSSIGNYFELKDGSAIHLTTGHWFSPNGEQIGKDGIKPDVEIADLFIEGKDQIYEKALNYTFDIMRR